MKYLITVLILSAFVFGQVDSTAAKICEERGHLEGAPLQQMLVFPPRMIDTDSLSFAITWNQPYLTATCSRCGTRRAVPQQTKADTIYFWKQEVLKGDSVETE